MLRKMFQWCTEALGAVPMLFHFLLGISVSVGISLRAGSIIQAPINVNFAETITVHRCLWADVIIILSIRVKCSTSEHSFSL